MGDVEVPLNKYGTFMLVSVDECGLALGIDTGPVLGPDGVTNGDSITAIADVESVMALVPALLDAVAQVNPLRPITDELLEWALVREAVRLGALPAAGSYLSDRLVTVAVDLRRRYENNEGEG